MPHRCPVKRQRIEKTERKPDQALKSSHDVLGFLKSRPRIGVMQTTAVKEMKPTSKETISTTASEEAAELIEDDRFDGLRSAWQRNETVDAFLKRAPITDLESASLGPWLWVGNPKPMQRHSKHGAKSDVAGFTAKGKQLLETFAAQRATFERSMPAAAPATITRKLRPYKEQLEADLLSLAVKTSTTCGKWMFFPSLNDYPRYWRVVAETTVAGTLGVTSKAATLDATNQTGLICVYTYNFSDKDDVRRVLQSLFDSGLCQSDGKPIYYKCNAYTYLGIQSDNEYKLRASMYSSGDFLKQDAVRKDDSTMARMEKKKKKN